MSYQAETERILFHIEERHFPAALKALQDEAQRERFAWTDTRNITNAKTFATALVECLWKPHFEKYLFINEGGEVETSYFPVEGGKPAGDIVGLEWIAPESKMGSEDRIFDAIAPWVDEGNYVEFLGEDGDRFRYYFDGEHCRFQMGTVTVKYED